MKQYDYRRVRNAARLALIATARCCTSGRRHDELARALRYITELEVGAQTLNKEKINPGSVHFFEEKVRDVIEELEALFDLGILPRCNEFTGEDYPQFALVKLLKKGC